MSDQKTILRFPVLIGDIGGTNARFQIIQTPDSDPIQFDPIKIDDFEGIQAAVETAVLKPSGLDPQMAILAAAGPINAKGVDLTNCDWNIDAKTFLNESGFQDLILLNDFEAQALSLPFLAESDLLNLGGPKTLPKNAKTKAVLGPGTGLGVGTLIRAGGLWVPVPGEGGHVDLGPRTSREVQIWAHLQSVEGRISGEQILSGSGLVNLYEAVCATNGRDPSASDPAAISLSALNYEDPSAVEALALFCTCLGRIAGDLALTTMATGGVYIAGGIGQKISAAMAEGGFRAAFEDKAPHSGTMRKLSSWLVTHPLPALVGLEAFTRDPDAFVMDIEHRHWRHKPA